MITFSLRDSEVHSIASYLRSATARFKELADVAMMEPPALGRAEQLKKHAEEAEKFAEMFDSAGFVAIVRKARS